MNGIQGSCPHCGIPSFFPQTNVRAHNNAAVVSYYHHGDERVFTLNPHNCASCGDLLVFMSGPIKNAPHPTSRIHPGPKSVRRPASEAPDAVKRLYEEAAAVEPHSERAAAALARACLQTALRDRGFKGRSLEAEIELAEADKRSSATLVEKLHIVRHVGNYSVHPIATSTGDLLHVEPGELDAVFQALDEIFDAFYVKPTRHAAAVASLNAKITKAGKPPIGGTSPTPP
jgi:ribosomal protein S27AE